MATGTTMNGDPQISVIVPCYNASETVGETAGSLLNQSHNDWEAIFINDGSGDTTGHLLHSLENEHPGRFRVHHQENQGLSATRNIGIHFARGQALVFLDADDLLTPGFMDSMWSKFNNREKQILYCRSKYFQNHNAEKLHAGIDGSDREWMPATSGDAEKIGQTLCEQNMFVVSSAMLPRSAAMEVGGFDESLKAMEDWDFWIRCLRRGYSFQFNPDPNAETHIRLHQDSMSTDGMNMFFSSLAVRKKHLDWAPMKAAWRMKRRFYAKAALKDLLQFKFSKFVAHSHYWRTFP